MERLNECLQLSLVEKLNLIEQKHHPAAAFSGCLAHREEHVGEVQCKVGVVGEALGGLDIQTSGPRAGRVDADSERRQDCRRMLEEVGPLRLRRQLEQRRAQPRRHVTPEVSLVVLPDFEFHDDPLARDGLRPELSQ
ncbi:MAG TPA: hypothetical protein VLK34_05630 [Nocardioidaceae bacterium]|nr:hypothetical protein [Nocardioidaceae bacterium]